MKKAVCLFLLLSVLPHVVSANDPRSAVPRQASAATTVRRGLSAATTSGFEPLPPEDYRFVVNDPAVGGDLDTRCTYRSDRPNGRLTIILNVTRVVNDVAAAVADFQLRPVAHLRLPAFDVDVDGDGGTTVPEYDVVYLNGKAIGSLTGSNEVWKLNEFDVPVGQLNFATSDSAGNVTPGVNMIEVAIDAASPADEDNWCTAIDWVELSVDIDAPILLVHGIFSSGKTWQNNTGGGKINFLRQLQDDGFIAETINLGGVAAGLPALDSIQSNAEKIHREVVFLNQVSGTTKVNLVTHSKGGLDAREFVTRYPGMVDKLIQLGTPNGGSPLADYIQKGILRVSIKYPLLGIPLEAINILAAPAGYQLTQPYMGIYNATHGSDRKVTYSSLAGYYRPTGALGIIVNPILFVLYGGPSDGVVPVDSVLEAGNFPRFSRQTLPPDGGDFSNSHLGETSSPNFYNAVLPLLGGSTKKSLRAASMSAAPTRESKVSALEEALVSADTTATTVNLVNQGSTSRSTFLVDGGSRLVVTLMYPLADDLALVLFSPTGVKYQAKNIASRPGADLSLDDTLGGKIATFTLDNPETGTWKARVQAATVTESGGTPFVLTSNVTESSVRFAAAAPAAFPYQTPLTITGTLTRNGQPLTGATVTAEVLRPDHSVVNVAMSDDGTGGDARAGDGVYTGAFTQGNAMGQYLCSFTAQGADFTRQEMAGSFGSEAAGSLAGPYTDAAPDADGDGLSESVDVTANATVSATGTYRVTGTLRDTSGNTVEAQTEQALPEGTSTVKLSFDGGSLYANHVDGPYTVASLVLSEVVAADGSVNLLSAQRDAATTAAYGYRQFERADILVTGVTGFEGVDTNGNGLFDQLTVAVGVELVNGGSYLYSAQLFDAQDKEIGLATGTVDLATTAASFPMVFDGAKIGADGVNGPFTVRNLIIRGEGVGGSYVADRTFSFGDTLLAERFEGFEGTPTAVVTLEVKKRKTAEGGGAAIFVLRRSGGDTSAPLTVNYVLSGTAENGTDYRLLSGQRIMDGGRLSAKIKIRPLADTLAEGVEKVMLSVAPGSGYTVGTPAAGKIKIRDGR